ncbi:DUF4191 domain-containing protein [Kutzneria sp. NPDC052558]|uniref:DUF4191 domain-containing protein n=1 Tax=Kutzneria sp. NPDC052558 TaxID=3364121 RepID=UPI0037C584BD
MAGKQEDKAAAKEAARAKRAESRARRSQIFEAFKMQRREDKALVPLMLAVLLGVAAVAFLIGLIWDMQWLFLGPGVVLGALGAVLLFGRRVSRTVYKKADGQPGAAGWALDNLRGNWRVTQAVAGTTQLDVVHRVLGLPGVILVAEGAPHRVKSLLAQEKKRLSRVVGSTPIYDIVIGNEEGEVPLRKLQQHMMRLPRNISKADVDRLEKGMAALASRGAALPKGPLPQGAKMRNVQRTLRRR